MLLRELVERQRLAVQIERRCLPSYQTIVRAENQAVRVHVVEGMLRKQRVDHDVERTRDDRQPRAAPLELPQRVVRAVEMLELAHRFHDITARGTRRDPPLHVELDPLLVTDAPLVVPAMTLDVDGVVTHEAVSYTHLRAHETPEHLVC